MSNNQDITIIAKTNFHGQGRLFGIKRDDRRRHMHIIGKTGMGKTSLLLNMAVSDIRNGSGLAFVDPHGDVADALLDYIPEHRIKDVVYFNPQDLDYPIAFNVLGDVSENQRHIVADGLVGVFKKIWADSWGPRLEYILRNTILTLLENENSTLLDIMRILVDKNFRANIVYKMQDPVLKQFWLNEFDGYTDKLLVEAISPIQNKVGQFTSSPLIRNIIGQHKSSFNLREIMDQKKILIMNLSKGAVGEGGAQLLGAMMITKMQLAAMSRVDIPENERQDFYAYIDEFQNFSTDSFAEILSEARKYRLSLILAHQYVEQLSEVVRGAVFGNVGTTIVFRIGAADAEFMEREFTPVLTIEDLVNLPKWKIYLKLMIDGVTSQPFSADTLPDPVPELISNRDRIIEFSRQAYGTSRESLKPNVIQTENSNKNSNNNHSNNGDDSINSLNKYTSSRNQQSQTNVRASVVKSNKPILAKEKVEGNTPPNINKSYSSIVDSENNNTLHSVVSAPVEYNNPILAKKLKEVFSRATSAYGDSEYLVKEKLLKEMNSNNSDKLKLESLIQDLLLDVKSNLMVPREDKNNNNNITRGKSVKMK
ncbi:MAG: hypothetical protein RLZZ223_334 [Candidatus Parcubacteria bacterium]|jgi:hypothetical protein